MARYYLGSLLNRALTARESGAVSPDAHHVASPSYKLVGYPLRRDSEFRLLQLLLDRFDVRGRSTVESEKWKQPHLLGDAAHFPDGIDVKIFAEMFGVQKEKVGTKSDVKLSIFEG